MAQKRKDATRTAASHFLMKTTLCSLDPAGLEALSTHIGVLRCSVLFDSDPSDVGLPHFIGSSMRMAHIIAKMSALSAN